MNRTNLPHGRFSLPLIVLLALGAAACGSAPEPGAGPEDTPSAAVAITTPPSTETPADPAETDAGPPAQPVVDETVDPSLPRTGGVADHPPGGGHPDETPREK